MSQENRTVPVNGLTDGAPQARKYTPWEIEKIREMAFAAYSARQGGPGDANTDWLEAERMFLATCDAETAPIVTRALPAKAMPARPKEAGSRGLRDPGKSVGV